MLSTGIVASLSSGSPPVMLRMPYSKRSRMSLQMSVHSSTVSSGYDEGKSFLICFSPAAQPQ